MSLAIWQLDPAQMTPNYNIAICDALAQAGCRVRYITSQFLYDANLPVMGSFRTDYLYFRGLNHRVLLRYPRLRRLLRAASYPIGHWRLLQEMRRDPPDVVHIQWSRLPRLDGWLIQQIRALRLPVIHTVHDVVPLFDQGSSTSRLQKIYSTVDALVVHVEANRTSLLKRYPNLAPGDIYVIPHIALKNAIVPAGEDRQTARRRLGLPDDVPVFLFFGSIRPYKGLDMLVEAFPKAARLNPDLHLVIAGRPDSPRDALVSRALGDQPNTLVRTEYIPYDEAWQYHVAADVIVFPYRHIYQSGALITAMGFGRAVIVTDVGGLPETVDGNGWIVPPDDADALADTILEAASDMERVRRMGERSLQLIGERHDSSTVARCTIAMYKDVLGAARNC
jgi:glycosyltransferase involved in cell wall biosynthesis